MKNFISGILFLGFLFFIYHKMTEPKRVSAPIYLISSEKPKDFEMEISTSAKKCINAINKRNEQVDSILCQINISFSQKMTVNASGWMALKKEKNFRLNLWGAFNSKEMDIGSNTNQFWFWSKRMNPPALHFANHENLEKTNLKTPLNPAWLIECLTLNHLDTEEIECHTFNNQIMVIRKAKGISGESIEIATLLDPTTETIKGKYLYSNGKMIASAEAMQTTKKFLIPNKLLIIWYEEGIEMEWNLSEIKVNPNIKDTTWQMPNMKYQINMGN